MTKTKDTKLLQLRLDNKLLDTLAELGDKKWPHLSHAKISSRNLLINAILNKVAEAYQKDSKSININITDPMVI